MTEALPATTPSQRLLLDALAGGAVVSRTTGAGGRPVWYQGRRRRYLSDALVRALLDTRLVERVETQAGAMLAITPRGEAARCAGGRVPPGLRAMAPQP